MTNTTSSWTSQDQSEAQPTTSIPSAKSSPSTVHKSSHFISGTPQSPSSPWRTFKKSSKKKKAEEEPHQLASPHASSPTNTKISSSLLMVKLVIIKLETATQSLKNINSTKLSATSSAQVTETWKCLWHVPLPEIVKTKYSKKNKTPPWKPWFNTHLQTIKSWILSIRSLLKTLKLNSTWSRVW